MTNDFHEETGKQAAS